MGTDHCTAWTCARATNRSKRGRTWTLSNLLQTLPHQVYSLMCDRLARSFFDAALARMAATGMRGVTIEQQLESDKKAEQESKVKPQLEEDILRRQQRGLSGSCCWLRGLSTPIQYIITLFGLVFLVGGATFLIVYAVVGDYDYDEEAHCEYRS